MGVQYADIAIPLREFQLQTICYFDGLSKNELLGRIHRVRDAAILANDKVSRAVNQPPPSTPPRSQLGFKTPGS